jgi:hypothetical protein
MNHKKIHKWLISLTCVAALLVILLAFAIKTRPTAIQNPPLVVVQGNEQPPVSRMKIATSQIVERSTKWEVPIEADEPIWGLLANQEADIGSRHDALRELYARKSLGNLDIARLATLALMPVPAEEYAAIRERAFRNDLFNYFRNCDGKADALVDVLAYMAASSTMDTGLRDYALQHVAAWLPELENGSAKNNAESALLDALNTTDHTFAGTALLGLWDLSKRGMLSVKFDPGTHAMDIFMNRAMDIKSRISALALLSELKIAIPLSIKEAEGWISDKTLLLGARRAAQTYLETSRTIF